MSTLRERLAGLAQGVNLTLEQLLEAAGQAVDEENAAEVQKHLDQRDADQRDAGRFRALQADLDKPPHEGCFSVHEYGTRVFDLAGAIDRTLLVKP